MKNTIINLLVVITLCFSSTANAQNPNRSPKIHDRIVQAKLGEIKSRLKLEDSVYQKFRPIYMKYDWEISGIDIRKLARLMKVEPDSLTTDEANQLIADQLLNTKKLIEIREKYLGQFRTVLSPQQIIKFYQTEAEMRKKVMNELKKRMLSH
jgi:hypothetical protein